MNRVMMNVTSYLMTATAICLVLAFVWVSVRGFVFVMGL